MGSARKKKQTGEETKPLMNPGAYEPGSLGRLMAEYIEWGAVKLLSVRTTASRRALLEYFLRWAEDRALYRPEAVTRNVLEAYQRWMHHYRKSNGNALGPVSRQQRVMVLRGFFSWCVRSRRLEVNPASELEVPRLPPRLPKDILRPEEVEAVLAQHDVHTAEGLRNRAILEVFYATGMRRLELVQLGLGDMDLERGVARIRQGKGGKERLVPIGKRACGWVRRYLDEARPMTADTPDCGRLFIAGTGTALKPGRVTAMVHRTIKRSGVEKTGSCHLLRHSMATLMLENGADLRVLQEILGHENLGTTALYTHLTIKRLQQVHDATHPGNRRTGEESEDEGTLQEQDSCEHEAEDERADGAENT